MIVRRMARILAPGSAQENLDQMGDRERGYIRSQPAASNFIVVGLYRDATGRLAIVYDDVAV